MYDWQTYDFSEFPGTADEIAVFLAEKGFKGEPAHAFKCPISRYLTANVALPENTARPGWAVCASLKAEVRLEDGTPARLAMHPQAVAEFIHNFDTYQYPNLVEH